MFKKFKLDVVPYEYIGSYDKLEDFYLILKKLYIRIAESSIIDEEEGSVIYINRTCARSLTSAEEYRKSDKVIGLYDVVNGVFYTNAGSGTFTKGADVNAKDEYGMTALMFASKKGYKEIIEFLNKNINEKKVISFVACEFDDYEGNDHFKDKLIRLFKEKEYSFDNTYVIDDRLTKEEMINSINNSSIVFMLGGDTIEQISNVNKYELKESIINNKIVIGMSAGSINMAKKVVLAADPEDNIPELSVYEGLGLTNINIEPHCEFNNKEHWIELEKASEINEIVVMNDDAFIICDEDIKYYGTYLILKNKEVYINGEKKSLEFFMEDILNA